MSEEFRRRVPLKTNDYHLEVRRLGDRVTISLVSDVFNKTTKVILLDERETRQLYSVLGEALALRDSEKDEEKVRTVIEGRKKFIKELRQWQQ